MHLDIGSGGGANYRFDSKKHTELHVDLVAGGVRADGLLLPFRDSSFEAAQAIHVLEHIPRADHRSFLHEVHRTLKPGAPFHVEVPNLLEVARKLLVMGDEIATIPKPQPGPEWTRYDRVAERIRCWTLSVYGKHRHVGDAHCWGFMPYGLRDDLDGARFVNIKQLVKDKEMISQHYRQEPVILFRCEKP